MFASIKVPLDVTFPMWRYCLGQRSLTITVWLTSCLTGLDSSKQVKLMPIQHKQSSWIQTKYTGGQQYSETSPLELSTRWLKIISLWRCRSRRVRAEGVGGLPTRRGVHGQTGNICCHEEYWSRGGQLHDQSGLPGPGEVTADPLDMDHVSRRRSISKRLLPYSLKKLCRFCALANANFEDKQSSFYWSSLVVVHLHQ